MAKHLPRKWCRFSKLERTWSRTTIFRALMFVLILATIVGSLLPSSFSSNHFQSTKPSSPSLFTSPTAPLSPYFLDSPPLVMVLVDFLGPVVPDTRLVGVDQLVMIGSRILPPPQGALAQPSRFTNLPPTLWPENIVPETLFN